MYVGNNKISSIYFGDCYKKYLKNFTESEWEVNTTNGWEVDLTSTQAIIKKFKIDTWGIRRNIKQSTEIYNRYVQWKVNVSGLDNVNKNILTFGKAYYPTGGYKGFDDTSSFAPGKFPNDSYTNYQYVSGLIIQAGGYYSDMKDTVAYPSEQMLVHPWDVGNRTNITDGVISGTWFDDSYKTILIGLYGSVEDHIGEVYDISNNPIIITLIPDLINPGSLECWKFYNNGTIYEKEKTLDNYWIKYKYVTKTSADNWSLNSNSFVSLIEDPSIVDYNFSGEIQVDGTTVKQIKPWVTFNYTAQNSSFWTPIKTWFANNDWVNPLAFNNTHSSSYPSLFGGSNIDGEITLNFNTIATDAWNARVVTFPDIFYGSKIQKINFNFKGNTECTSALNAFRSCSALTDITTNKAFWVKELAGVFEWCSSLTTIPANLFNYALRNRYNASNFCYTFEGCTKLVTVPKSSYAENIDSEQNILRTETLVQAFNNCAKLESFYPILDLAGCSPDSTYLAFAGCTSLTHILIKNLNKGDWRFDGTSSKKLGTLDKLDTESVKYLLNNVRDIAHLTPETESCNNSFAHSSWTREDATASYTTICLRNNGFQNYCSSPVNTEIHIANTSESPNIYFLPKEKINASDMEDYKINFTDNKATVSSNGNSNYGFYASSDSFKDGELIYVYLVTPWDRDSSSVTEAKIYVPEVWKTDGRFTQDEIDICNSRGWHIYIGDTELTTI